ncbi:LOW QUALITY PROTEIN: gustatory and pheromone receptor 39a [Drosophila sulfurigaster albostrigata]|uniref:LOW QUALITY PROTEIN: gustatory and pheromone receptor 39a n=1 Tax=Drosophila sulfurigaster albostrigata TaxID=89887 RepID=UPI002D21D966|nr:LOW QUALITY PROTEIN: gustatory and pheromone receptor 39a [Drosophila sulfurigaster albostrigata]
MKCISDQPQIHLADGFVRLSWTVTVNMSPCRDMRLYLRFLYALGMICARLDEEKCLLQISANSETYALIYTLSILAGILGCFSYAYFNPDELFMNVYTKTGNFYERMNLLRFCVVLCLLHICLYWRRRRHILLVETLLKLNRLCSSERTDRYFMRIFITYSVLFVVSFFNYANGYAQTGLEQVAILVYVAIYTYGFLSMSLLVVFFVCLQRIIAAGLAYYNQKLDANDSSTNCRRVLVERQRLLSLITGELNNCFGLLILPIVPLILLMAPTGPLYLLSTAMEGKFHTFFQISIVSITASLWNVPWLAVMTLLMRSNFITVEANKTAKILAKIPRTGSGLDKMVEKFLLKNLRQQPILTAYGFFALDKSTLFKLFTAIFTYMVILVQFKEMENSTKSLQKAQLDFADT